MAERQFKDLDFVALAVDVGRWPAGTTGTIVDIYDDADAAMVEISDDHGCALEFLDVPYGNLRHARGADQKHLPV
jgi:hypothetical protein